MALSQNYHYHISGRRRQDGPGHWEAPGRLEGRRLLAGGVDDRRPRRPGEERAPEHHHVGRRGSHQEMQPARRPRKLKRMNTSRQNNTMIMR